MLSSPVHSFFFPLSKEVPCAQGLHRITLTSFCGFWGDGDDDSHSFWDSLEEGCFIRMNENYSTGSKVRVVWLCAAVQACV